ncbi:101aa long hypothetical protein [Pyrococcus horikoshii OT3]|uniref:Uncharacterized protein n=1 Tax=Pyrococcus horikoshii (strain ATCC 700860 / DSM 12428 / JCM 9974 / NBRC 100139 / OT-3) TaxID=70601 RepID=O50125_PYRHO|nr:101aa long hypothetical protein [Pyrococcus horikoshii OT3]
MACSRNLEAYFGRFIMILSALTHTLVTSLKIGIMFFTLFNFMFSSKYFMAQGFISQAKTILAFFARRIENGPTPANISNTISPSLAILKTLILSVANLGEK